MGKIKGYHEVLTIGFVKVTNETVEKAPEPILTPSPTHYFLFSKKNV